MDQRALRFHMLFGYLIVVRLLALVRIFGRLPDGFSPVFACTLEASTRPFHAINYFGSLGAPRLLGYAGTGRRFDQGIAKLLRRLDQESDFELARGMHYPTSWDPYFKAYMTLADIYRYPTQHFEHHRRQLTLDASDRALVRVHRRLEAKGSAPCSLRQGVHTSSVAMDIACFLRRSSGLGWPLDPDGQPASSC